MDDDTLARLISMPNTIVTSHQAFLTEEALKTIAESIVQSLLDFFNISQTTEIKVESESK
jgi:D-lactate dehydrogenase